MKLRSLILFLLCACVLTPWLHGQAQLLSGHGPLYPPAAAAAGIDGAVVLRGTISKEGRLENLRVLSGPPELRQAAIDAVASWTYQPYKHFGHLVTVGTTVTVNFNMGKGAEKAKAQAKAQEKLAHANPPATEQPVGPPVTEHSSTPMQ